MVWSPQPTQSSICFVECGSVKQAEEEVEETGKSRCHYWGL